MRWLVFGVLLLALAQSAAAQGVRRDTSAAAAREAVSSPLPTVRAEMVLRNDTQSRVTLRVPRQLASTTGGAPLDAAWTRRDRGEGAIDGQFLLEPQSSVAIELRAELPEAGTWEAALEVVQPPEQAQRFTYSLTRTAEPVPADLLQRPAPVRLDLPFPARALPEAARAVLEARNTTERAIPLGRPAVTRVAGLSGTTEFAAALPQLPDVAPERCTGSLGKGERCALALVLPAGMPVGRYSLDVSLPAATGGASVQSQVVEIRASAWWAALLTMAGALVGAAVDAWRRVGRPAVAARLPVAERAERARTLATLVRMPALRRAADAVRQALVGLDGRLRRGGAQPPDLAPYDARLTALAGAASAEAAAADLPEPARMLLGAAREALVRALTGAAAGEAGDAARTTAVDNAVAALEGLTRQVQDLVRVDADAAEELRRTDAELRSVLGIGAVDAAWAALSTARRDAFAPPGATTAEGFVASRAAALVQVTRELADARAAALAELPERLVRRAAAAVVSAGTDQARKDAATAAAKEARALSDAWPALTEAGSIDRAKRFARQYGLVLAGPGGLEAAATAPERGTDVLPKLTVGESALQLDLGSAFAGPGAGASPGALHRYGVLWEVVTNGAVLAAIGALGVLVLWADSPGWGTPRDLAVALLAGVGTRLAVGLPGVPR